MRLFITLLEPKHSIIFDEPTVHLDKTNKIFFYELINDLKDKYNIAEFTQDNDELDRLYDRMYKLNDIDNTTLFN